jgi:chemotaxis protein methyltransferase WspC
LRPGGEGLTLDPALLARIRYLEADVLDESFMAGEPPYQAVICRHLLIYLTGAGRERLAANIGRLLAPGGALFTSPAEAAAFARLGLEPHGRGVTPGLSPLPACQPAVRAASPRIPREPQPAPARESEAPAALLAEARRLADAGKLHESLALLDEALSSGCPTAGHYHLKGAALLALGREDEAERALRRALYLDPAHLESLSHLEHLARARGRDREADLLAGRARKAGEAMP